MTKIKVILVISFILTFAAGAAAALLATYLMRPLHGQSWLAAQLNLTAEQREQMNTIWSDDMRNQRRQRDEQRTALRQDRDKQILALLSKEQRSSYDAINADYSHKLAALPDPFDEAVKRTKDILTPAQAEKYDELMKRPPERGAGQPRGGRRGPPDGPAPEGPPPEGPPPPRGGD